MSENLYKQRVLQARKKFLELTQKNEEELLRIYQEASEVILEGIKKNKELDIETEYLEKLNKAMKKYEEDLNNRLASNINKNIEEVSSIATDIQLAYVEAIASDEHIKTIFKRVTLASTKKALEKIVRGNFYADGKSLDNRIWNITKKNIEDIDRLIKGNISRGANARKLAEQLERYINPNKRIEAKTLEAGMNSSISYQSQRLARTSISHAFSETCVENAKVNPFNKGLKWNLSPSHFERQVKKWGEDICDVYANQDDYRLGKGVFPAEEFPLKHPNCLCFSVYINTPIKDASTELKDWSMGAKNDKLDKWYAENDNGNKYNSNVNREIASTIDIDENIIDTEWLNYIDISNKNRELVWKAHYDLKKFSENNDNLEKMIILDLKENTKILEQVGQINKVDFNSDITNIIKKSNKDSLFIIHNHPSNSTFSIADLVVLYANKSVHSISVEGSRGYKYYCRIENRKRCDFAGVVANARANVIKKYSRIYGNYKNNYSDEVWEVLNEEIIEEITTNLKWTYRRFK